MVGSGVGKGGRIGYPGQVMLKGGCPVKVNLHSSIFVGEIFCKAGPILGLVLVLVPETKK